MTDAICIALISATIPGVIGLIGIIIQMLAKKDNTKYRKRREQSDKALLIKLDKACAGADLAFATALAVEGEKINGEMHHAKERYREAIQAEEDFRQAYEAFLITS